MLGTEKFEKKIRRLSWIGQRSPEDDVAQRNTEVVVDSGDWTIHAPKELVWEVVKNSQPECIRNPFLRVDKEDGVDGNKEANNAAEVSFTAELAVSACRERCKLRNEAYKGYKERLIALEKQRLANQDVDRNAVPMSAEEELEKLMKGTHATHEQWAVTYSSPAKGKGHRWVGGDSATTYHTLSADSETACTYWVEERITYRPEGKGAGPGITPPGLWEKTLRGMVSTIKRICEEKYQAQLQDGKSEKTAGKERAISSS